MLLYADEDFSFPVVEELRRLGHDVLTAQEDGRTATPDHDILARANDLGRSVLTYNRRHFERLHRQGADHVGILSATHDSNFPRQANRINAAPGWNVSRPLVPSGQSSGVAMKEDRVNGCPAPPA